MKPSAKIIADSISPQGHRLTTMEVVMHRFILAEMNTHRAFSRNSASSRAIPFDSKTSKNTIRYRVTNDEAFPVHWGKEQKGMQSGESFDEADIDKLVSIWRGTKKQALSHAVALYEMGLHKSLINRLLEPFMWHTAIITATEWDNFFWQRCHPDAQPEMKAVADEMQRAYYTSTPNKLTYGAWHLPYFEFDHDLGPLYEATGANRYPDVVTAAKQVSTARCARVSYLTQDGKRDIQEDLNLFERLKGSGHWSPFEHVATPMLYPPGTMHSNFNGWKQFRKEFPQENRRHFIPNLPELKDIADRISRDITGADLDLSGLGKQELTNKMEDNTNEQN
jgi:thymidylate synthase ThyX